MLLILYSQIQLMTLLNKNYCEVKYSEFVKDPKTL